MTDLLPGTPVSARGLRWQVVHGEPAGAQHRYRLRCSEGALRGLEFDFLHPFEAVEPAASELDPRRAGRLDGWLLYHQAFLLEQELGPDAMLAELIARRRAHRILIVSPAGPLLSQWHEEMRTRFGLRGEALERRAATAVEAPRLLGLLMRVPRAGAGGH